MKYKQAKIDSSQNLCERFERQLPYTVYKNLYIQLKNNNFLYVQSGLYDKLFWLIKLK